MVEKTANSLLDARIMNNIGASSRKSGPEYIKSEIVKTGFPLELEVYSLLSGNPGKFRKSWIPLAQDYFFDEDSKNGRSIDVSAFELPVIDANNNIVKPPIDPLKLNFHLAIECKKSSKNLVLFPLDDVFTNIRGQVISFLEQLSGYPLIDHLFWKFNHYHPLHHKIALNHTIFPRGGKDEIFEAIMQLVKYITYSKYKNIERLAKFEDSMYNITIWFPIIVYDGEMWNVSFKEGEVEEVTESKHTIIKKTYRPIQSMEEANFLIDIVHRSYFKEFLEIITKDIDNVIDKLLEEDSKELMDILNEFKFDSRRRNKGTYLITR